MKTRIGYTIIVLLFVFLQDIYAQQKDTIELVNIPKRKVRIPCPDLSDCYDKVIEYHQNNDTLYVHYAVDSTKQHDLVCIHTYSNAKRKMYAVVPKAEKYTSDYVVIKYYDYTYLFEKKKDYYAFQKIGSTVVEKDKPYRPYYFFCRRRLLKELKELKEKGEYGSGKISMRR